VFGAELCCQILQPALTSRDEQERVAFCCEQPGEARTDPG
jgi:hypothetical protein